MTLTFPAPFFGGKRRVASEVWRRFGDVAHYVEPFAGSGAVLLGRPADHARRCETLNDADGHISNFFRAVRSDPASVAHHADHPVIEQDLVARHLWLVGQRDSLTARLEVDPDWHDAKAAGWWVWGACCWIGGGWCSGTGPWVLGEDDDGRPALVNSRGNAGQGISRKLVHLGDAGRGISRRLVHLGDAGQGINRQLVHLGDAGRGERHEYILQTMTALAARLRDVRVACGDWARVVTPSVLWPISRDGGTVTGVLLDPPYPAGDWHPGVYAVEGDVAGDVHAWAVENGENPALRLALCGYEGHYAMPPGWTAHRWKAAGGYGSQGEGRGRENARREVIWFSPSCIPDDRPVALSLWDVEEAAS